MDNIWQARSSTTIIWSQRSSSCVLIDKQTKMANKHIFTNFIHVRDKNRTIKDSWGIYWFLACKLASVSFQFQMWNERNAVQNPLENNRNNSHRSIRAFLYQAVLVFSLVSLLTNVIQQCGGARIELPGRNYGNHGGTLRGGACDVDDGCGALLQGYFQLLHPHLPELQTHPARYLLHPFRRLNCWNHQTVSMLPNSKVVWDQECWLDPWRDLQLLTPTYHHSLDTSEPLHCNKQILYILSIIRDTSRLIQPIRIGLNRP